MRKLFQILFFVFVCVSVFAQEGKDSVARVKNSKWVFGINGGINYSKGYEYPSQNPLIWKDKRGPHFSISAISRARKTIGFRSNLGYDNIGFEETWEYFNGGNFKVAFNYHVLNIDALCELRTNAKPFVFYSTAGIKSGYVLSATESWYIGGFQRSSEQVIVQGISIWGKLNAGVNIYLGNSLSLGIDVNYNKQLSPFFPEHYIYKNVLYSIDFYSITAGVFYKKSKKTRHVYKLKE